MGKIEILDSPENTDMIIQYISSEPKVFFDICDDGGRIVLTGTLHDGQTKVCKNEIGKGFFNLVIVDGTSMEKKRFFL